MNKQMAPAIKYDCMQNGKDNFLFKKLKIQDWQKFSDLSYNYYLNLNSFVSVRGFTKIIDHNDFLEKVVEFKHFFNQYNLICIYAAFIVVDKNIKQYLHRDKGPEITRLLWPIKNCVNSQVIFYKVNESNKKFATDGKSIWHFYEIEKAEQLDYYVLSEPHLVNLSRPHFINLEKEFNNERISLYFMFNSDPINLINNLTYDYQKHNFTE